MSLVKQFEPYRTASLQNSETARRAAQFLEAVGFAVPASVEFAQYNPLDRSGQLGPPLE
jgi:hypothetical protein